jgi:hypothetical protein
MAELRKVAIVGSARIPFARAYTGYAEEGNLSMLGAALGGLVDKYNLKGEAIGEVMAGAVLSHSRDFNLAREASLDLMARRSLLVSFGWTLRDYVKRVWDNSGEDNVLFLAGGIAFNLILAALPFVLLLAAGATYLLPLLVRSEINSTQTVYEFIDRLLPAAVSVGLPDLAENHGKNGGQSE